jgi:hypothetical protein
MHFQACYLPRRRRHELPPPAVAPLMPSLRPPPRLPRLHCWPRPLLAGAPWRGRGRRWRSHGGCWGGSAWRPTRRRRRRRLLLRLRACGWSCVFPYKARPREEVGGGGRPALGSGQRRGRNDLRVRCGWMRRRRRRLGIGEGLLDSSVSRSSRFDLRASGYGERRR